MFVATGDKTEAPRLPWVPLSIGDTLELNDHREVVAGICRITQGDRRAAAGQKVGKKRAGFARLPEAELMKEGEFVAGNKPC
jgi:hypothetical protein